MAGLFDRARLERGQTALVAGAAGGVGHLAVQFARQSGARVMGTGSSRNRDFVLVLGTDTFVDYTQQDVTGELVSHNKLRVEIAAVFPLTMVQRAHELSESGHTRQTDSRLVS